MSNVLVGKVLTRTRLCGAFHQSTEPAHQYIYAYIYIYIHTDVFIYLHSYYLDVCIDLESEGFRLRLFLIGQLFWETELSNSDYLSFVQAR